jgi:transposase
VHLVELSVMEQRYQAVMAVVQDGWKITEVADRLGVTRQAVHKWIGRYEAGGLPALADRSHRPNGCSHQISPQLEAMICELRRQHPGWGPRRILHQLGRQGVDPLPGRSSIYRCLKRHNLIELRRRKKRRDEFRRWERDRPMQLWQMDLMSGVLLNDATDLKVVTSIDDHSRFCVAASLVPRATSRAVCEVFKAAMLRHGVPDEVLNSFILSGVPIASSWNGRLRRFQSVIGACSALLRTDWSDKALISRYFHPGNTGTTRRHHQGVDS